MRLQNTRDYEGTLVTYEEFQGLESDNPLAHLGVGILYGA